MRKIFLIFLFFLSIAHSLFAVVYYARSSGTWVPGVANNTIFSSVACANAPTNLNPTPADEIQVCSGVTLTIAGNGTIKNLFLTSVTSKLIINTSFTLTVSESFTNNGALTYGVNGPGTIQLLGTADCNLTNNGTPPNVIIGNGITTNTVTYINNTLIADLTISTNATFYNPSNNMTFNGNFVNHGTYIDDNPNVTFLGNFTNNGNFTQGIGTYYFTGVTKTFSGTSATTFKYIIINGVYTNNLALLTIKNNLSGTGTLTQGVGATLNIEESISVSGVNFTSNIPNIVEYSGTGTQTIKTATYYNLTKSKTGNAVLAGNITITGGINISGGTLDCSSFSIIGSTSTTFTMNAGTTLLLGSTANPTPVSFPVNFTTANITLDPKSTVAYYTNNTQTISHVPVYGNLTLSTGTSNVSKLLSGTPLKINGNLHITSNGPGTVTLSATSSTVNLLGNYSGTGNLSFSTGQFTIGGNYTNTGVFTPGTGQIVFDGNTGQQFTGAANTTFYSFRMNNSSPSGLILNSSITITNQVLLDDGIIYSSGSNLPTFAATAIVPIGSLASYVDGPVVCTKASTAATTLNFPIGKNGSWRPAVLNLTHTNTTPVTYQGELFNSSAMVLSYTLPASMNRVSGVRYWEINRQAISNLTSATIQLYYNTDDWVTDFTNLAVAKDNGAATWLDLSGSATANTTGIITSAAFNSFSKFTLANKSAGSNLLATETITTSSIAPTSFCPLATVTVPYTISGTFNPGNKFTAQLSDASGSFASPTNIGTIASTGNGSISATIPGSSPNGTGFRIRVVSDNPVVVGTDNGINLSIVGPKKFVVDVATDSDNLLGYVLGDATNSLRKCIRLANENCGHDTIAFNLGAGGPFPILINSALPNLTDNSGVTIDGWNNSGNNGTPNTVPVFNAKIGTPLNANYKTMLTNVPGTVATGLTLTSDNNVIKGLVLQNFGDGTVSSNDIAITISGSNNSVLGCYVGMDNTGTVSGLKTNIGISISGSNNQIGNGTASGANLISGLTGTNAAGILITSAAASNNSVRGNIIGLQKDGTSIVAGITQTNGVIISTSANSGNSIGGTSVGEGNVISGNTSNGVNIASSIGGQNIFGNRIGVCADGITYVTGNTQTTGIYVSNSPNNSIGGNTTGQKNIISGNVTSGVTLTGTATNGNKIKGNYIGLDFSGTTFITGSAQIYGVEVTTSASGNIIGGTTTGDGNVLSGNNVGILLSSAAAAGNSVFGNIVGTQADGLSVVTNANQSSGIWISSSPNNIVGGNTSGYRNIISGNTTQGVQLTGGSLSTGNQLKGNYIGTGTNGTSIIAGSNQIYGVTLKANNCTIGGAGLGEGNVISGNTIRGIYLSAGATGNMIKGNYFGPGSDLAAIPGSTQSYGIYLFGGASNNNIGGIAAGEGNVIANNSTQGIYLTDLTTTGNLISRNQIYSNTGKQINLNYGASQANNGNSKPVITTATSANVSGTTGVGQTVEIFKNTTGNCNDATNFVGATVADGTGAWSLATALTAGDYVLATSADGSNNTSEFSSCVLAVVANTISTGVIAPFYFCTGQVVNVPYTVSGTFSTGNKFTAQLSDATGSFASPINIGTLSSLVSGTINATIPAVVAGTGYRIRVVADNPVTTGVDNGTNININLADGGIGTWTWTGNQSNNWFDCKNWNKACMPDLSSDVIIPGGTPNNPTITGAIANCKTILINSSAGAIVNLNSSAGGVLNIAQ